MAGIVQNHDMHTEFWRPADVGNLPVARVAQCQDCGSEFSVGARYCHVCGNERNPAPTHAFVLFLKQLRTRVKWQKLELLLGLSRGAAVAFFVGSLCILAALLVGFIYQAQTTLDWEAIQMWRIEWLLGALVAFSGGLLLRKSSRS